MRQLRDLRDRGVLEHIYTVLSAVLLCWLGVKYALQIPIDFNAAYNIALAKSLGSTFTYDIDNIPKSFSYLTISVNGPIQYIGALGYALTHEIDGALVAGVVSSALVVTAGIALVRRWFAGLGVIFFWIFPVFTGMLIAFNGYVWAAGAALIAFAIMERGMPVRSVRLVFADRRMWIVAAWFSAALASKLIIMFAVFSLAFGAALSAQPFRGAADFARQVARSAAFAASIFIMSALLLFAQLTFSLLHTERSLSAFGEAPGLFIGYFQESFAQGYGVEAARPSVGVHVAAMESHLILWLLAGACVALLVARPAYAVLVAFAAYLWLKIGMDEPHMSSYFLILLVLGFREALSLVRRAAEKRGWPGSRAQAGFAAALAVLVLFANPLIGTRSTPPPDPNRAYAALFGGGESHYSPELVRRLREHRYVMTSGYWQFPEISDRWRFEFYDRISLQNARLWDKHPYLLFDRGNTAWPVTTVADNCGSDQYAEGTLVLCAMRPDVPVGYVRPAQPFPPEAQLHPVSLRDAGWELSAHVHRARGGPGATPDFEYAGTGESDQIEGASVEAAVVPGRTYVLAAWVDPSKIAGGATAQFELSLSEGNTMYSSAFYTAGPPARYVAGPWTCPPGVTRVRLGLGLINSVIPNGETFRFSPPALSYVDAHH